MKNIYSKTLKLSVVMPTTTTVYANAANKRKAKLEWVGIRPDKATK